MLIWKDIFLQFEMFGLIGFSHKKNGPPHELHKQMLRNVPAIFAFSLTHMTHGRSYTGQTGNYTHRHTQKPGSNENQGIPKRRTTVPLLKKNMHVGIPMNLVRYLMFLSVWVN